MDDLNPWLGRELKVRIITADAENDKLVLSAREILKESSDAQKKLKVARLKKVKYSQEKLRLSKITVHL